MKPLAPQSVRTFFVTSVTYGRTSIFQTTRMAILFLEVCRHNRDKGRFQIHEYVLMPNHFHLLLTPAEDVSLEKAVQFIKGNVSFQAKRRFQMKREIWQPSFTEHRIKDAEDYLRHCEYIRQNPVRAGLAGDAAAYPYSSASGSLELDPVPHWLRRG